MIPLQLNAGDAMHVAQRVLLESLGVGVIFV